MSAIVDLHILVVFKIYRNRVLFVKRKFVRKITLLWDECDELCLDEWWSVFLISIKERKIYTNPQARRYNTPAGTVALVRILPCSSPPFPLLA